eukprot:TRINITY_DN11398_c0_g1_i2.p1 TRINITY_DN11398_c0_g1~~TRINITY_DN11398_c0_g1_i2.p1  ORF type:complete len:452 (+),score=134.70 TRINITY_DN11398_c0_g1_i2:763-2118(+)
MTNEVVETDTMVKGEDDDGNKTINKYAVIQEIGRGAYGKVKLVVHLETEQFFALKILDKTFLSKMHKGKDKTRLDDVEYEIAVMKRFSHRNVVSLHEVINDPTCHKVYLILDYVAQGCIWKIGMPPLSYDTLRKSIVGMCHGLDYIHLNNVLHRDVKPDNLLVNEGGVVRWCDFGVSSARDADHDGIDDLVQDTEGTPAFLTPEQIKNEAIQGTMTDIWALGVTIFCVAIGRLPFTGSTIQEMNDSIVHGELDFGGCRDILLMDLLSKLLDKDLMKRMGSINGVREVLNHPFLEGCEGVDDFADHQLIKVTDADVATAVRTGHNIKLKLASTVNAAMKVQSFKLKLMKKRQERLSMNSADAATGIDPTSPCHDEEFHPCMSPTCPDINPMRASPLRSRPNSKKEKMDPALYFKVNDVPQLVDQAVRQLVMARPDNPAVWLSEYFSSLSTSL